MTTQCYSQRAKDVPLAVTFCVRVTVLFFGGYFTLNVPKLYSARFYLLFRTVAYIITYRLYQMLHAQIVATGSGIRGRGSTSADPQTDLRNNWGSYFCCRLLHTL